MFEIKSRNADIIFWDYPKRLSDELDYDFIYHYIEVKKNLKKLDEITKNKKIIKIIMDTYKKYSSHYLNKDYIEPRDNRWVKLIIIMNWLNLFNQDQKKMLIRKFANYKFTEDEPKLPQAWNRVWAFTLGLDIRNINCLKDYFIKEFDQIKENIKSYIPTLDDVFHQNIFGEGRIVMLDKYFLIRNFCNEPVFEELFDLIK